MKSLELLEEINKILIDAKKRANIVFEDVGEYDKIRGDFEHNILNKHYKMSAKEKREQLDELFKILAERHERKYEYRELAILKELYELGRIRKKTKRNNKQIKKVKSRNRSSNLL